MSIMSGDKIYKIGTSLACADQLNMGSEIGKLIEIVIEFLHIDIMDGHYVNNFCFGTKIFFYLEEFKNIEAKTHLMVEDPYLKLDMFNGKHINKLSFHIEAYKNLIHTLKKIHNMWIEAVTILNATTSHNTLDYLYPHIDYIAVMAVETGDTAKDFINPTVDKVTAISNEIKKEKLPCIFI